MRRILVPADFPVESHKALSYGAALAKEFGAKSIKSAGEALSGIRQ
jgi:hypothetical protein